MANQKLLTQRLSEFASTPGWDFTIRDVLYDLAEWAPAVTGADGAAVSQTGQLRSTTALDEGSSNLERVQESGQAGPCVDALQAGEVVAVADLAEAVGGWGAYGHAAREAGS